MTWLIAGGVGLIAVLLALATWAIRREAKKAEKLEQLEAENAVQEAARKARERIAGGDTDERDRLRDKYKRK